MPEDEPKVKMGAPKKRDKAVIAISEAMGTILSSDVLSVADMKGFPALREESPRNQLIMCATACGFSQAFVGKALGVKQQTVWEIINRIDPDNMFRISKDAKKAFATQLYETRVAEALMSITPEKLEEASARDLMNIAKVGTDASASMNQTKHREVAAGKLDMMMDQALAQMDEAEVKEEDLDEKK